MSEVRQRLGRPLIEDLRSPSGTPIVCQVDSTGPLKAFALRADQKICDLYTGFEKDTGAWDDLRFPAQAINPGGAAAAPTIDTVLTGYPGTLLFSALLDNYITGVAQMPHGWRAGSDVYPHIHWSKTTADGAGSAVDWEFRYRLQNIGQTAGAYSAWMGGNLVAGDLTTLEMQNVDAFGAVSMSGMTVSSMMYWQVRRLGASDAYGSDARLIEFDLHLQMTQVGTETQEPDF